MQKHPTSLWYLAEAEVEQTEQRRSEMDAIEILEAEHRTIKRVLQAMDRFVEVQAQMPEAMRRTDLKQFIEFIRLYADRIHHGKEEEILFERMVAAGFPTKSGPLAVMYHEHDQGRAFVKDLAEFGEQETEWSSEDQTRLAEAARGYAVLLRNHIQKEDNVLYPMAESGLPADAMALVDQRVEEFENSDPQRGEKLRLEALADELSAKFERQVA